eukprot:5067962-Lingulodinium_polyedra.AAC.1
MNRVTTFCTILRARMRMHVFALSTPCRPPRGRPLGGGVRPPPLVDAATICLLYTSPSPRDA